MTVKDVAEQLTPMKDLACVNNTVVQHHYSAQYAAIVARQAGMVCASSWTENKHAQENRHAAPTSSKHLQQEAYP